MNMSQYYIPLVALLLASPAALPAAEPAKPSAKPNIVIILADDMGYSDPGYMGGEARTPNLDRLSKEGVTFLNCFNNAKCAPTRASLMTGMSCQRVKCFKSAGNITANHATSMAEVLGANGYSTIIAGKWHINPMPMEVGFQRQFGVDLQPYYFKPDATKDKKLKPIYLDGVPIDISKLPEDWYSTDAYTDFAIKTIETDAISKNKPFFLYLAYTAPHGPGGAPKEDVDKYLNTYDAGVDVVRQQRYARMVEKAIVNPETWKLPPYEPDKKLGEIRWDHFSGKQQALFKRKLAVTAGMIDRLDQNVGRLIEFLKKRGVNDNTLIVFLSDNGATAEEGAYGGLPFDELTDQQIATLGIRGTTPPGTSGAVVATVMNTPLRFFKTTLWEGGMRTSMIVHWPGHMSSAVAGKYVRDPVAVFDLAPSCYQAAGVVYPPAIKGRTLQPMDGISLLPLLDGGNLPARDLCFSYKDFQVVRNERWKLLGKYHTRNDKQEPWQLFDLSVDQSEITDVASKHPDVVKQLAAEWDKWDKQIGVIKGYQDYWDGKGKKNKESDTEDENDKE